MASTINTTPIDATKPANAPTVAQAADLRANLAAPSSFGSRPALKEAAA